MIQNAIMTPWSVFTPTVFRMMKREYVERFFDTGELMLSSFEHFSLHKDEERKDDKEGWNIIVGRGNNSTVFAVTGHGRDAYVLCSTACYPTEELMEAFEADAAIQIFDTTNFAFALTKHIPGVRQGFEGYCFYADRSIECKIGDFDIEHLRSHPEDKNLDLNKVGGMALNMAGQAVFFRKRTSFRHQLEYRWVWITSQVTTDTLIVHVPEAREFCLPHYNS
jgi:hypothetical protein